MKPISYARQTFLKTLGLGAASLGLWGLLPGCSASSKPNIIVILADDMGYGDLSCYGNDYIRTPNLDALAAGGMKFTDFHSNGPVCSPTRAALLTGRYQQRAGIDHVFLANPATGHADKPGMAREEVTFAEVLKGQGYVTGCFGKWHLGYPVDYNPIHQGFDEFRGYVSGNVDFFSHVDGGGREDWWDGLEKSPEEGYVTDLISRHAVDFIQRHQDEPFCLYLPHEAPHFPYQGRNDLPFRFPGDPNPGAGPRQDRKGAYKEMVEVMDEGIGKVVDTVRRLGLAENTFIFFCSDNGATREGSNGPLAGHKGSLWEGGHRVPALAWWPGKIPAGSRCDQTVLTMDIFPTLLTLTGAVPPMEREIDGVDLAQLLVDGKKLPQRKTYWSYERRKDRPEKVVREGAWKLYIIGKEHQLFNLNQDLAEKRNLAADYPERVRAMEQAFQVWYAAVTAGVTRIC